MRNSGESESIKPFIKNYFITSY